MSKMLKLGVAAFALVVVLNILPASAQKVAVMGAEPPLFGSVREVQNKLIATGLFTAVDAYDLAAVTPTLEQMEGYNALLVYTSDPMLNPTSFGDNLANYVDGGGGVVAAVFATASIPIQGRFNADNYWAIQPTGQQDGKETLGTIFAPEHPILDGVSSFDGGTMSYRPSADSLHPDGTRVANWTGPGNIALVATRVINGVRRADLGFFPPSSDSHPSLWVKTTDGAKIMANALLWSAGKDGTIGTEFKIRDSGLGAKKGKVLVGNVALKILEWTDSSIRCQLTKAPSPGTYDVTIKPKAKGASLIVMRNGFTVKAPEINSVEPANGSVGEEIIIRGFFFSTKKGKVFLEYQKNDQIKKKNCRITYWVMDVATGESEIRFLVPKGLDPGPYSLWGTNKVGSASKTFTIEALP